MLNALYRACDQLRHRARLKSGNQAHAWGERGEDLAHRYLQRRGYAIIARNFLTATGSAEVDLIAMHGEVIVFVEVKTRSTEEYGTPDSAVDDVKRRRIVRGAREFLQRYGQPEASIRFDIVNVLFEGGERVSHIEDAFTVDGVGAAATPARSAAAGR